MGDCKEYFLETSRRISFEYALLGIKGFEHSCKKFRFMSIAMTRSWFYMFEQLESMIQLTMQWNLLNYSMDGAMATT